MYNGCGSDNEPYSTEWCKCLMEGINKNKLNIIDWGCGYGRFLNFLLVKNINSFKYYGFELHGEKNGDLLINFCNENYISQNTSERLIKFGFVDNEELIKESLENCSTILLGSVFTHMAIEDVIQLLEKFKDFISSGGEIVFSLITEKNKYELNGPGAYGIKNGYDCAFYSQNEIERMTFDNKYKIEKITDFQTDHVIKHGIYKLSLY